MYLLQLVQALKYENFNDIQGGLEPGSKRDSQGLSDDSTLDRSEQHQQSRPPGCTSHASRSDRHELKGAILWNRGGRNCQQVI